MGDDLVTRKGLELDDLRSCWSETREELAEARQAEQEALAGHDQMQCERDALKEAIGEALAALYDQSLSICPRVERARKILERAGCDPSRDRDPLP